MLPSCAASPTRSVVERTLDGEGRVTETHGRVFEVRPKADDPDGHRWLTVKDGVPTPHAEPQRHEGEYRPQLARAERRLASETAAQNSSTPLAASERRAARSGVARRATATLSNYRRMAVLGSENRD